MPKVSQSKKSPPGASEKPKQPPFWKDLLVRLATGRSRKIIAGLGFALLVLHLLEFPHNTFDTTHDLSSHATFEYYAANNFQFGTEVYQNVGPFGYVHYAYSYIGYLHEKKVILKTICRVALALLVFWMCSSLKSLPAKIGCWASFFVFFSFGDVTDTDYLDLDESIAYITLHLTALWLLQNRKDARFRILTIAVWAFLAFMSLTKHTCFVLACSIVIAVLAQNLFRRNFVQAIEGLSAFIVSLVASWTLAGQQLENLPAFVRGVFAFSGGYNEAMALITPIGMLFQGIAVAFLMATRIIFNWWHNKAEFGRAAVESFLLFVVWKHAFVRSDVPHITIFFYSVSLFAIPVFFNAANDALHFPKVNSPRWQQATVGWFATTVFLCFIAFYMAIPDCDYKPERLWNHLRHNTSWLIAPRKKTQEMKELLREAQALHALPQVKAAVQNARIDFFGHDPGHILLNNLKYSSRPMPIAFAAANKLLQEANESFYRNPDTAPPFVLCKLTGVDDRFFCQDDALALRALLDNYRPLLVENQLLLLQRRSDAEFIKTRSEKFVREETVKFDRTIELGETSDALLWLEVKVEPTLLGKLVAFFYKAPPCYIGMKWEGEEEMQFAKFVTAMGECGAIVKPLITSTIHLSTLYDPNIDLNHFGKMTKMAIVCDPQDKKFFQPEIKLRWHLVERPKP